VYQTEATTNRVRQAMQQQRDKLKAWDTKEQGRLVSEILEATVLPEERIQTFHRTQLLSSLLFPYSCLDVASPVQLG
jgi:hypothetical protein